MVICDAVLRKLPGRARARAVGRRGVLQRARSEGNPEYPHYTRPAEYRGWGVPEVLLSGHHERDRVLAPGAEPRTRRGRRRSGPAGERLTAMRRAGGGCSLPWAFAPHCRAPLRLHPGEKRRAPPSRHEQRHRNHRARAAAPRPHLLAGRPRQGPLPGDRGHAQPHAGLRGRRHQAPGPRRPGDVHRPQAVLRRRRRAHVPGALAEDRADRARRPRRRAPRQALLPARPRRQARPRPRAPLHRPGGDSSSRGCCIEAEPEATPRTDRRGHRDAEGDVVEHDTERRRSSRGAGERPPQRTARRAEAARGEPESAGTPRAPSEPASDAG